MAHRFDSLALSLSKGELPHDVLVEPRAHYSSFDKLRTSGCTQPSNALAQDELVDRSWRALLARPEPVEGRADPGCTRRTTSTLLVLRQCSGRAAASHEGPPYS